MKLWYQSKTVIINSVLLIVGVLNVLTESPLIQQSPKVLAGVLAAVAALNLVLRFVTSTALVTKTPE